MPLKIHHPKNNARHKQAIIICQGKCNDSAKVTGVLVDKATGTAVPGGQKLTSGNKKHWGYRYKGLADGSYKFTITETNSPALATDVVDFTLTKGPKPLPGVPPTLTAPADGEDVGVVFYPYGTSNVAISNLAFSGNGNTTSGTTTPPDLNGDWTGEITGIDTWPTGGGYSLTAANGTPPPAGANSLSIAT